MKKIILVFGGKSAEHEVSINSAKNIAAAMDKKLFQLILVGISAQGNWYRFPDLKALESLRTLSDDKAPPQAEACSLVLKSGKPHLMDLTTYFTEAIDCAFPINHGTFGEDGCIQGYFQMMNLPFVGCDVLSSSISMNKEYMKKVFQTEQIPTARYVVLKKNDKVSSESLFSCITQKLGTPFFIKPACMGSSVGVHKIKTAEDLKTKLPEAFQYDHKVLAEEMIEGREVECSVLGSRDQASTSVCGELIPQHEFYSYEAKYLDENGALLKIPADIPEDTQVKLQKMAIEVFRAMNCEGFARVDFFVKKNGEVVVNELNTLPGFTKISMYPAMWGKSGLGYTELITKLIDLAFQKFSSDRELKTTFLDFQDSNT